MDTFCELREHTYSTSAIINKENGFRQKILGRQQEFAPKSLWLDVLLLQYKAEVVSCSARRDF
jgi:hypothetical protein